MNEVNFNRSKSCTSGLAYSLTYLLSACVSCHLLGSFDPLASFWGV